LRGLCDGNDGQKNDRGETIVDEVGEQCDVLPEAGQEAMKKSIIRLVGLVLA